MIQNQPIIHDNRFIVQPLFPNRNYQLTSSQAAPSKQSNMITNSKEIWQAPVENKFNQSLPRQQNLSSPNLNIQQLSQDLLKLKEQLKKLAERGEQIGVNRAKAEQVLSARGRLQFSEQNNTYRLNNNSVDNHQIHMKQSGHDLIYNPSTNGHPNNNLYKISQLVNKQDQKQYFRRDKIDSFISVKQQKSKVVPINNPNKRQFTRLMQVQQNDRIKIELRLQLQIKQLKQKISKIQNQLALQKQKNENLILQLKNVKNEKQQLKDKIIKLQKQKIIQKTKSQQEYELSYKNLNKIIQNLQLQLLKYKTSSISTQSFNDILKSQLEQNKLLKIKLQQKIDQIQQLKDNWNIQKKNNQNLKDQLTIQQMKASTQLRGKQIKLQIQLNDKLNQLKTTKNALQTLDLKYKTSIKQIKQKDQFIMKYIVSRSKQQQKQQIKSILQQYKIIFPENRIMNDLIKQQKQIQLLKLEIIRLQKNQ